MGRIRLVPLVLGLASPPLVAQGPGPSPAIEALAGYGPAPRADALLLGVGVHVPTGLPVHLRFLATRAARDSSVALQAAALLSWQPIERKVSPYLAAGFLWRRISLSNGPLTQTDGQPGILAALGGVARIGGSARLRLFFEVHGILASGAGFEAASGLRYLLGSPRDRRASRRAPTVLPPIQTREPPVDPGP